MPLLPEVTTLELEDHFFGSGAFEFGWFGYRYISEDGEPHFPVLIVEVDDDGEVYPPIRFGEEDFKAGIQMLAKIEPDRTYQDLLEDMDASDVDNAIQLAIFGEIRYA